MAVTVATLVGRVRKSLPDVLESTVYVAEEGGRYHRRNSGWGCTSRAGQSVHVTLSAFTPKTTCERCLRLWAMGDLGGAVSLVDQWLILEERVKTLEKTTHTVTMGTMLRRVKEARQAADVLESLLVTLETSLVTLSEREEVAKAALLERLERAAGRVKADVAGETGKERLFQQVRTQLEVGDVPLDEGPTLVGIPTVSSYLTGTLLTLIEQFGIRRKDGVVLLVPRYVADWMIPAAAREAKFIPTAGLLPGEGEAVAEAAAGLWDPTSTGAMRSLYAAVEAARAVLA